MSSLLLPAEQAAELAVRFADAVPPLTATQALLGAINHMPSRHAVMAERALLAALGGNCHSPIAVLTTPDGDALLMHAALYSPDGAERVAGEARFAAGDDAGPASLAPRSFGG